MRCPKCRIEMAVGSRANSVENGKPVTVLRFICRNRQCPNWGKGEDDKPIVVAERRVKGG